MVIFRSFASFARLTILTTVTASLCLAAVISGRAEEIWYPVPRPKIDGDKALLRVAYAVNPSFSHMSDAQLAILLAEARQVTRDHFGIELTFSQPEIIGISDLFALRPNVADDEVLEWVYDFKGDSGNRDLLVEDLLERLQTNDSQLDEIYAFAAPHLTSAPLSATAEGFAVALTETLLNRLNVWRIIPANDRRAVIDDTVYNEWTFWDTLAHGALPYDIAITNQLVASAEYYGMDVHSALRGGITVGTTSYSRDGPFHTYAFLSTFPFSNDYVPIVQLRGGARYDEEEAARLAGAYLAHEIGHVLLHLGHPFNQSACVMNPAQLLDFRAWQNNLDAERCALGSSAEMVPGAAKLSYNAAWVLQ
ncbi:MAG: hypothetical protein CFH39_00283 [Alphaproteobacteria bacterium MarineAlpha10_Bin2]|nr:MAG: hypothetical protein CFH39_00283 [Alphaproteobacteria bacterium MarineAlpha10_Bin2]